MATLSRQDDTAMDRICCRYNLRAGRRKGDVRQIELKSHLQALQRVTLAEAQAVAANTAVPLPPIPTARYLNRSAYEQYYLDNFPTKSGHQPQDKGTLFGV